jgi:hypothetical protein
VPLGVAVYRNLVERGLRLTAEELDAGWTARQGADGRWLVTLTYSSRGRKQQPTWELEGPRGPVRADDRLAADLAYIAPESPPPVPKPALPPKVMAAAPTDGDREAARRVAVARREAEARLDEAARAASKRNAELARRGNPPGEPPVPPPEPPVKQAAKHAAKARKTAPQRAAVPAAKQPARPVAPAAAKKTTGPKAATVRPPAKAVTPSRPTGGSAKAKAKAKAKPKPKAKAAAAKQTRPARPKTSPSPSTAPRRATAATPTAEKGRKARKPAAASGQNRHAKAGSTTRSKGKAPAHARQGAKPLRRQTPVLRTDLAEPVRPNGSDAAAPASSSRSRRPERLRAR